MQVFAKGDRGKRFTGLLDRYYPWLGQEALPKVDCISLLYHEVRNPLTHGLALDNPALAAHRIELATSRLDETQSAELLNPMVRPRWLTPTIVDNPTPMEPTKVAVFIPTLYWSVQRMIRNLFADSTQVAGAEALSQALFS
jgi:hypothetical protein